SFICRVPPSTHYPFSTLFRSTILAQELFRICIDVEDYISSASSARTWSNLVRSTTVTRPMRRLSTFLVRKGLYFDLVSYHESGIKTKTKSTDDLVSIIGLFESLHELGGT